MQNCSTNDHAALLAELLPLVDERYQAALEAAIADMERMDKVERMKIDLYEHGSGYYAVARDGEDAEAKTARAAIDGVPE